MIARTLEPEIMDEPTRAKAYAKADFSDVNRNYVEGFLKAYPDLLKSSVLDLGCGPADIPVRIVLAAKDIRITAVDGSPVMIELAKKRLCETGLEDQITLLQARIPGLPLADGTFDAVVSNSLAHHLPDPSVLWEEVRRLLKPGGKIYITDLIRAESKEKARETVETYSGEEHPLLKDDFYHSLLAAFTVEEVQQQLKEAGLTAVRVQPISDRHWLAAGSVDA